MPTTDQGIVKALKRRGWAILAFAGLMLGPQPPLSALAIQQNDALNLGVSIYGIAAVHDLNASTATVGGVVNLAWTEPYRAGTAAPYSYVIRVSTTGGISSNAEFAAALPLSAFSSVSAPAPGPGGGQASLSVTGLTPGVTYCFAIREQDSSVPISSGTWLRTVVPAFNANNCATAITPMATPTGLSTRSGLNEAFIHWNLLTSTQTSGLTVAYYALSRSTSPSSGFAPLTNVNASSYLDYPLAPFTTYYYQIAAVATTGVRSLTSASVAALPTTELPMEPFGLESSVSGSTFTLSWSSTIRFADTTLFVSTTAPATGELSGYEVFRSTDSCGSTPIFLSSIPYNSTSFSDNPPAGGYFYQVKAYNVLGPSSATLTVSNFGDQYYNQADDCKSQIVISAAQSAALKAAHNGLGGDIMIVRQSRPQDIGPKNPEIIRSAQWTPMLNGVTDLPNYYLPSAVKIILHYYTTPSGALAPQSASPASNVGMYWYNGARFNKLYGKVDATNQTVTVESPNLGVYQVRTIARSDGVVFDASNISGKVITPNGDGLNDTFIFTYDPGPNNVVATGKIYDMRGMFVANMTQGSQPNTITWDGKMNGRPVTSGVYIYRLEGGGKSFSGTVVVAR